jgi:hypothetical protein
MKKDRARVNGAGPLPSGIAASARGAGYTCQFAIAPDASCFMPIESLLFFAFLWLIWSFDIESFDIESLDIESCDIAPFDIAPLASCANADVAPAREKIANAAIASFFMRSLRFVIES